MVNDWLIPGIRTGRAGVPFITDSGRSSVGVDFVFLSAGSLGGFRFLGLGIGSDLDAVQHVDRRLELEILGFVVGNVSRRATALLARRFVLQMASEARLA